MCDTRAKACAGSTVNVGASSDQRGTAGDPGKVSLVTI